MAVPSKFRSYTGDYLIVVEVAIYTIIAFLLSATAILALAEAGKLMWDSLAHWSMESATFHVLDQLLLVLMLVEILHTVRISIRSHTLITEPFLIVGLIASIRRMLVITLEVSDLTKQTDKWAAGGDRIFQASMLELGLLGVIILVLVVSIILMRRSRPALEEDH